MGFAARTGALGEVVGDARLKDRFPKELQWVAGIGLKTSTSEQEVQCAATLLALDTFEMLCESTASATLTDRTYFEAAVVAMTTALRAFPNPAELVLVEGHGVSGVGRQGLAVSLGVSLNLPVIGVSTEVEVGTSKPLHEMRGAFSPLREEGVQVGWMLRSKVDSPPLVVSPGHFVSMAAAPELVMSLVREDRMPEPIRLANVLLARI